MRKTFHDDLNQIGDSLIEMTQLVSTALNKATTALLTGDLTLAEEVIAEDEKVDALYEEVDDKSIDLLARQQPVAVDLRVVVAGLRMVATLERMGDLARHIAETARRRYPDLAVPEDVRPTITSMATAAQNLVSKAGAVLAGHDIELAAELQRDDDYIDTLHRKLFTQLVDSSNSLGVEAVIDVTLLGRFYERYADHAVSLARRVTYLVTGVTPEKL